MNEFGDIRLGKMIYRLTIFWMKERGQRAYITSIPRCGLSPGSYRYVLKL